MLTPLQYAQLQVWEADPAADPVRSWNEFLALQQAIEAQKPPPLVRPKINTFPLDLTTLVMANFAYDGNAGYNRFSNHVEFKTTTASVLCMRTNLTKGGDHTQPLAYTRYGMLAQALDAQGNLGPAVNIATVCTLNPKANYQLTLTLDWSKFSADGCPVMLAMCALDANGQLITTPSECFVPFFVWSNRNGQASSFPLYIAQNCSFDWVHPGFANYEQDRAVPRVYQWAALPKKWLDDAPVYPLVPTVSQIPATITNQASELTRINLLPCTDADAMNTMWPRVTRSGIVSTGSVQGYFWSDLVTVEFPPFDELDGLRTRNLLEFPLHAWASKRPDIIARKVYGGTKLRIFKIFTDGTIVTLLGLRNKGNKARYRTWTGASNKAWDEPTTLDDYEIVAEDAWDPSVPRAERWPKESWFSCFNPASTVIDPNSTPVSDPPGAPAEQTHYPPGPQMMVGDTGHGWLLLLQFQDNIHTPPVSVKRILQLKDPWGGDLDPATGNVIVAERGANRIIEVDWTGKIIRTVIGDPNAVRFGGVDPYDRTFRFANATQADITSGLASQRVRAGSVCCAPEGISVMDDWFYFGSYAMGGYFRVHRSGAPLQLVALPKMDWLRQSHFCQPSVSDGTMFPRHTLFGTTFAIINNGMPEAFGEQAGTSAWGEPLTHAKDLNKIYQTFQYDTANGTGGQYGAIYPTAVHAQNGTLVVGSSNPGISIFVRKSATDVVPNNTKMRAGARVWRAQGYDLLWTREGFAPHRLPLPWGEDPNMDYWLTQLGHAPPGSVQNERRVFNVGDP